MGRRKKQAGFEALAALPWPVGFVMGIVAYLVVRYGIGWWFSHQSGMLSQGFAQQSSGMFAPLAWTLLGVCWLAALFSYLRTRSRRRFLETRTSLESLAAGGWRQFEQLVGEAFRRQGYSVEETGLGGPDGGIDLILRKDGRRTLVQCKQCKQWKRQQVGVSVVREMYGLLAHHQAHSVKIACIGTYTKDAQRFAQGKPIELIDGEQLLEMVGAVQKQATAQQTVTSARIEPVFASHDSTASAALAIPSCPRCSSALVQRTNRRTGEKFLGCIQFPTCRGTL
ncbi:restriction endonuclease [Xanthomonas vesicatoria]|uniref:restriction endonuclease n=1 Tax=Xanthomonas vesicatoria TaxID=56460 RepID=UPI00073242FA|nr:restriction endonuclease [Xanthomonas vesicatoria]KTF36493.1 restriction endonuclease [Xanthomonas vesicatoria]MCC8558599.1 restriction endonuclease [Xanthomonas vesicatoria]MCC8599432.1 restriction endonuclease [Xanthomonas vesicatoria]MCC8608655.1 restriction endonuclease [Xanthomonas vesicatoria]MCC8672977.1 restriction endonuclease [Xanthomonas vesicatoria]